MVIPKGYKQTEVGIIPEDWEVVSIKNIAQVHTGSTPSTLNKEYWNGTIPWVTPTDIKGQKYIYTSERLITEKGIKQMKQLNQNSLLITCVASIGKNAILKKRGACNQQINALLFLKDYNLEFYYYVSEFCKEYFISNASFTTLKIISKKTLENLLLICPSINEQIEISNSLCDIDELMFCIENVIRKKKAIKQGEMQNLLTGKRRLSGFTGKWSIMRFDEVFEILPNNTFTREHLSSVGCVKNVHYGDVLTKYKAVLNPEFNYIPYVKSNINLSKYGVKSYVKNGDIIIADTAEDETVGKAVEVINVDCPILAGLHTLLCRPKFEFAEKFLGYYLNTDYFHNQLIPFIVGTKVSSISRRSISQTYIEVPDLQEQKAIADILSDMDSEIEKLEQKLEKYRKIKQGMMEQLLTGKIRLI